MLTHSGVAKLSTDDICIYSAEEVITDSSPLLVNAHFHTSLSGHTSSNQSHLTVHTSCNIVCDDI